MAIHAAMIHRMDIEIGRVLDQLKAMGAFENTAIFFLSDNGASAEQIIRGDRHDRTAPPGSAKTLPVHRPGWSSAANTPFRLHKSWVHEGGITTPLIVHWPQGIAARGELRHNPGHLIDLAPTILEMAGGKWPTDASPASRRRPARQEPRAGFAKDGSVTHDYLWWYHDGNRAIRIGDWKLVADHETPWELYDLRTDRCESTDSRPARPQKVREWSGNGSDAWRSSAFWRCKTCRPKEAVVPRRLRALLAVVSSSQPFGELFRHTTPFSERSWPFHQGVALGHLGRSRGRLTETLHRAVVKRTISEAAQLEDGPQQRGGSGCKQEALGEQTAERS